LAVLGVSADTPAKQKKFKEKYDLPYSLLADTEKKMSRDYKVIKEKSMYGKLFKGISRMSFLIGPDGKLLKVFDNVKPAGHAEEVLAALKELT
jgi:peroxiredoxin Q/BCP